MFRHFLAHMAHTRCRPEHIVIWPTLRAPKRRCSSSPAIEIQCRFHIKHTSKTRNEKPNAICGQSRKTPSNDMLLTVITVIFGFYAFTTLKKKTNRNNSNRTKRWAEKHKANNHVYRSKHYYYALFFSPLLLIFVRWSCVCVFSPVSFACPNCFSRLLSWSWHPNWLRCAEVNARYLVYIIRLAVFTQWQYGSYSCRQFEWSERAHAKFIKMLPHL